jgi:hypothetical protein
MSEQIAGRRGDDGAKRKPFRAVDVLSGSIDRPAPKTPPARKQISAQLEPAQLRLLGELHARLNATAERRIEKSELVGLGIELLAAALDAAGGEPAPEPDEPGHKPNAAAGGESDELAFRDTDELRAYVRSYVRTYGK